MDKSDRERLWTQLESNALFRELRSHLANFSEQNDTVKNANLAGFDLGGLFMREQAIGAQNQLNEIFEIIDNLKQPEETLTQN